jgi:hypothetical protein
MRAALLCAALALAVVVVAPGAGAGAAVAVAEQDDTVAPSIADGSAQRALDAARARWHAQGPRNYTYRARLSCFCTTDSVQPHTFVVRNRKPQHPPKGFKNIATAHRLFKLVQKAIDERVDGLRVRYRANGLVKQLDVDQYQPASDDEYSYTVDRFSSP